MSSPANGVPSSTGVCELTFGELFRIYVVVSNKLVGVLLRARKHGLVDFEGETLFQGRDDHKVVTLRKEPDEVRRMQQRRDDGEEQEGQFQWGKCMKKAE